MECLTSKYAAMKLLSFYILLLQKTYTPDFLTGKQKKNRGELSMYMIEDAHEAIIEKEVFEAVQKKKRWSTSCK